MTVPILNIQRRMAEIGRIRLGHKVPVGNSGKSRPGKLETFRLTSGNQRLIEEVARLYGGEPKAWANGGKSEFEVFTTSNSLPVIVVKGGMSQWLETWSGGGCVHRCDGQTNVLTDSPCDQDSREHLEAKPTTRLSVMLRDIESLGVWRMESHGWNAAAEIPSMAELAMFVGDLVPANLNLAARTAIRDGKTSQFVVPVLDLQVSKARLVELMGHDGGRQIGAASSVAQITSGPASDHDDWTDLLADATTPEECRAIWLQAGAAGALTDALRVAITSRAQELAPVDVPQDVTVRIDEASTSEGEPVNDDAGDEPDVDAAWMNVVTVAGQNGWSATALVDAFEQWAGLAPADSDPIQITGFLTELRAGRISASVPA